MGDFSVADNGTSIFIEFWNESFHISQPTEEQLNSITDNEINCVMCCKNAYINIDVVSDLSNIIQPVNGSIVCHENKLKIYINGSWVTQQDIIDLSDKINLLTSRIEALESN